MANISEQRLNEKMVLFNLFCHVCILGPKTVSRVSDRVKLKVWHYHAATIKAF